MFIPILVQAQLDPATAAAVKMAMESTDTLVGKDLKWWFIFIIIVFAIAGVMIARYLLSSHTRTISSWETQASKYITSMETQLTEQRANNTLLNKQMIDYIIGDHLKSIEAQQTMAQSMRELAQAIRELSHNHPRQPHS